MPAGGRKIFGAVAYGAIEMRVGLVTGFDWGRGPADSGCQCGQAVGARPAVPQFSGCLRQTACGGSIEGLPAAGLLLVDGAGLPAAACLRADCLPAGVGWLVRVRFYLGDLPLKIGDRAGLWGTAFWPDQGANLGAPNQIGHSGLGIEAAE